MRNHSDLRLQKPRHLRIPLRKKPSKRLTPEAVAAAPLALNAATKRRAEAASSLPPRPRKKQSLMLLKLTETPAAVPSSPPANKEAVPTSPPRADTASPPPPPRTKGPAWDAMVEREQQALVARNTELNSERVAYLTHRVEQLSVPRAPDLTPESMTTLAAASRRARAQHLAATGVALGPGEAPGFVPRALAPERKGVRWAGTLEVGRDDDDDEDERAAHVPGAAAEAAGGRLTRLDTVRTHDLQNSAPDKRTDVRVCVSRCSTSLEIWRAWRRSTSGRPRSWSRRFCTRWKKKKRRNGQRGRGRGPRMVCARLGRYADLRAVDC